MEKDMKMPDEIYARIDATGGIGYWHKHSLSGYPETKYVRADLAPQQVDLEALKRCDKGGTDFHHMGWNDCIDYLASRNLITNNPQAAPDNAGALEAVNRLENTFNALMTNPAKPQIFGLPAIDFETIRSALAKQGDKPRRDDGQDAAGLVICDLEVEMAGFVLSSLEVQWPHIYEAARRYRDAQGSGELLKAALRAIGDHHAPNDCYSTGPMNGNEAIDSECPACAFINKYGAKAEKLEGSKT